MRHFPKQPDRFEFDAEVAAIFPNMAERSIPLYAESHIRHASMLYEWLSKPGCSVLDVGASRGRFIRALVDTMGVSLFHDKNIKIRAIDASEAMCDFLRKDFPMIDVVHQDVIGDGFKNRIAERYDIVCANYLIQFVRPADQWFVLRLLCNLVKPGGVLILGQKDSTEGRLGKIMHDEYLRFRIEHGYSREEIEAKTRALKGSMYPMLYEDLVFHVKENGFSEVLPSMRWMMFNTLMCIK